MVTFDQFGSDNFVLLDKRGLSLKQCNHDELSFVQINETFDSNVLKFRRDSSPAKSDSCFLISSSMASGDSGRATDPPWPSLDVVIGGTYLENDVKVNLRNTAAKHKPATLKATSTIICTILKHIMLTLVINQKQWFLTYPLYQMLASSGWNMGYPYVLLQLGVIK